MCPHCGDRKEKIYFGPTKVTCEKKECQAKQKANIRVLCRLAQRRKRIRDIETDKIQGAKIDNRFKGRYCQRCLKFGEKTKLKGARMYYCNHCWSIVSNRLSGPDEVYFGSGYYGSSVLNDYRISPSGFHRRYIKKDFFAQKAKTRSMNLGSLIACHFASVATTSSGSCRPGTRRRSSLTRWTAKPGGRAARQSKATLWPMKW